MEKNQIDFINTITDLHQYVKIYFLGLIMLLTIHHPRGQEMPSRTMLFYPHIIMIKVVLRTIVFYHHIIMIKVVLRTIVFYHHSLMIKVVLRTIVFYPHIIMIKVVLRTIVFYHHSLMIKATFVVVKNSWCGNVSKITFLF